MWWRGRGHGVTRQQIMENECKTKYALGVSSRNITEHTYYGVFEQLSERILVCYLGGTHRQWNQEWTVSPKHGDNAVWSTGKHGQGNTSVGFRLFSKASDCWHPIPHVISGPCGIQIQTRNLRSWNVKQNYSVRTNWANMMRTLKSDSQRMERFETKCGNKPWANFRRQVKALAWWKTQETELN
jgi:hypothetical protein